MPRKRALVSLPLLMKTLTLTNQGPSRVISLNLNYFYQGSVTNTFILGFRAPTDEWERGTNIHSIMKTILNPDYCSRYSF